MPRSSVSKSNSPPRRQRRSPSREQSPKRRSPPRRQEPQDASGEPKVYVSGLPPNIRKDDIKDAFEKFGEIVDLFVINKDTFSFAFVTYPDHEAANSAINEMTGANIQGKSIKCQMAKPRPPRGDNNGGRGNGGNRGGPRGEGGNRGRGCFKCQQDGHFARQCPNADQDNNNRDNNRGPRRFNDNRNNKNSDDERTDSPQKRPARKRSASSSGSPARNQHKKESPRSPVRRRKSPSSSGSAGKRKGNRNRSRSRSAEMRKGKRRVSRSSSSSR